MEGANIEGAVIDEPEGEGSEDFEGMGESENSCPGSYVHMKPVYFSRRLHPIHNAPQQRPPGSTRAYDGRGMSVSKIMALWPPIAKRSFKADLEEGDTHSCNVGPAEGDCTLVYTKPPPSPSPPPSPKPSPPPSPKRPPGEVGHGGH